MVVYVHHRPSCISGAARADEERRAWAERWPRYCRACDGSGGEIDWDDPSDVARVLAPCPACTGRGVCGRCGREDFSSERPCAGCGWAYNDAMPSAWRCFCVGGSP